MVESCNISINCFPFSDTNMYTHTHARAYTHVCIYMYIYIHTHIYIYIYPIHIKAHIKVNLASYRGPDREQKNTLLN
jgi:hypothetical protein